ncbi:MAG: hypothetical protein CFH44_00633 [Proteobacteria bacterium]|nr:MAG: hypothetical protein CFH44_00633 [Pseudomonadota bacterium]|tara:strand:+ start:143 stop:544 length:402 start_codon:yes stop_codon:yes gene_type:complete
MGYNRDRKSRTRRPSSTKMVDNDHFFKPIEEVVKKYGMYNVRSRLMILSNLVKLAESQPSSTLLVEETGNGIILKASGYERVENLKKIAVLGKTMQVGNTLSLSILVTKEQVKKRIEELNVYSVQLNKQSQTA